MEQYQANLELSCRVRHCLAAGTAGPWQDVLSAMQSMIDAAFRGASGRNLDDLDEFRNWFGGWLMLGKRLADLSQAMESPTSGDPWNDNIFGSYFWQMVKSAIGDFYRERGRSIPYDPSVFHDGGALELRSCTSFDSHDEVLDREDPESCLRFLRLVIERMPITRRVPFRLWHYAAAGPLTQEELEWIAIQTERSPREIQRLVEEEFLRYAGADFPLSAPFIGELLGITPGADGRYNAVHQCIGRSRKEFHSIVRSDRELVVRW